ncbi:aldo/keto reductase [Mycobacterium sp. 852002-10029_SCH5224772]|uniref:aldo/keto reductase n=1 Tax=Mycobacterium sp. 852002-10029_SCH5224772 TaxID=1834083 RepID=UPI0007FE693E|nr:aldo/keto reductase [Mycobacterium sp. 852002-10029_SCH5224772]OBE94137.1 oxidoreductase [Mycobacterium sp. 852002-10029_SCH5224772]
MRTDHPTAAAAGTLELGGRLTINRLGFGTMRLTGPGNWGPPRDHQQAVAVLRRAVESGVTFIDTADSYGPFIAEELIRTALHPYPVDLVVATKAGFLRTRPDATNTPSPSSWTPLGKPEYLRQQVEMSLRRLNTDCIKLFQLHRIDPDYPLADQVGELADLKAEGKIGLIGLSEVSVDQLEAAQTITPIASVQNLYNLTARDAEPLVNVCTQQGIAFIPWFPLAAGPLAAPDGPLRKIAAAHHASPSQLALAWLLARSPIMLPIPGTSSLEHLDENIAAAAVDLTDDDLKALSAL